MVVPRNTLVVSCQSEGEDPFNTPDRVALFAKAAQMGGAGAIRGEGIANLNEIIRVVDLPVIGLIKGKYEDESVRITGSIEEVVALIEIGCDVIAIDGTSRDRQGYTGAEFIAKVKSEYDCMIMADIASLEEALLCIESGADCISTTLNGYTEMTKLDNNGKPNFELVKRLSALTSVPIFAEGRISTPKQARLMIEYGAYGVVVGTMITRPRLITQMFKEEMS